MSEDERRKRFRYRKKRNRIILFQVAILILTLLTTLVTGIVAYAKDNSYYVNYSEKSTVDYGVILKDNDFYEESFLGKDYAYIASLIDKVQENVTIDAEKSKDMTSRMKKGKFDFEDYLESMRQMRKMGGLSSIMSMLPGLGIKAGELEGMIDEKQLARIEAIVLSMTPKERQNPKLLNPSRKHRIAKGAGVDIAQVNRFIKQFEQSQKMMKQMQGMMGKKGRRMMMPGGMRFPF